MGTVKNVEMNYFNGTDYDVIRPETVLENVSDWADSIYSKEEVDELLKPYQMVTGTSNYSFQLIEWTGTGATSLTLTFIEKPVWCFIFGVYIYSYWEKSFGNTYWQISSESGIGSDVFINYSSGQWNNNQVSFRHSNSRFCFNVRNKPYAAIAGYNVDQLST